jgi:hypothetical protein
MSTSVHGEQGRNDKMTLQMLAQLGRGVKAGETMAFPICNLWRAAIFICPKVERGRRSAIVVIVIVIGVD